MKIATQGQNLTQEKLNFSLVLMETIVDTLIKVAKSKFQLAKIRAFISWKTSKFDSRLIISLKYQDAFCKLNSSAVYFNRKIVLKRFAIWNEKVLMIALKKSFDKDLNDIKGKYRTKLLMMSQEINSLNEKQSALEKCSSEYMHNEKSSKVLEVTSEPKEIGDFDELRIIQNENFRLKAKLQAKETKLMAYFEGLSAMIDNATSK